MLVCLLLFQEFSRIFRQLPEPYKQTNGFSEYHFESRPGTSSNLIDVTVTISDIHESVDLFDCFCIRSVRHNRFDLLNHVYPFLKLSSTSYKSILSYKSLIIIIMWLKCFPVGLLLSVDNVDYNGISLYKSFINDPKFKKLRGEAFSNSTHFIDLNWSSLYKTNEASSMDVNYHIVSHRIQDSSRQGKVNVYNFIGDFVAILFSTTMIDFSLGIFDYEDVAKETLSVIQSTVKKDGCECYEDDYDPIKFIQKLNYWSEENSPYLGCLMTLYNSNLFRFATTNFDCVLESIFNLFHPDRNFQTVIPLGCCTSNPFHNTKLASISELTSSWKSTEVFHLHGVVYEEDSLVLYYSQRQHEFLNKFCKFVLKNCICVLLGFFGDRTFDWFLEEEIQSKTSSIQRLTVISPNEPSSRHFSTTNNGTIHLPENVYWLSLDVSRYDDALIAFFTEILQRFCPSFDSIFTKNSKFMFTTVCALLGSVNRPKYSKKAT
ncbi:hypothetical protein GEMRC1_007705 [Eukaryota sp. GEM-RC1]